MSKRITWSPFTHKMTSEFHKNPRKLPKLPKAPQKSPRASQRNQKGIRNEPKGTQSHAKGNQRRPQTPKRNEGDEKYIQKLQINRPSGRYVKRSNLIKTIRLCFSMEHHGLLGIVSTSAWNSTDFSARCQMDPERHGTAQHGE